MPSLATLKLIGWAVIAFSFIACLAALRMEQAQNAKLKAQLHECTTLRQSDRDSYVRAQAEAEAKNAAQLVRIKSEQQRITDYAQQSYEADLARLRAELGKRLSQGGAAPAQGHSIGAGASPLPDATGKPDQEARVCIPTSLYVRGAETELQLDRLIDWIDGQLKIDPNGK